MGKQTTRYKTQWAAQFFAAAELTRRGYLVSLTFGNAPTSDLLVLSLSGAQFTVDVKGQSTKNLWLIKRRAMNPNHYFILVYLPKNLGAPRYFVLSSDELMKRREEHRESVFHRGKYDDVLGGINFSTAYDYENRWDNLPQ